MRANATQLLSLPQCVTSHPQHSYLFTGQYLLSVKGPSGPPIDLRINDKVLLLGFQGPTGSHTFLSSDLLPLVYSAPTQVAFLLFLKQRTEKPHQGYSSFKAFSLVFCLLCFALRLYAVHLTLHAHVLTDVTSGPFLASFVQNNATACIIFQIVCITIWNYIIHIIW